MKPVERIVGTMAPLPRADVDTDQIIPQQFLKRIERTGYGQFLFHSWAHDHEGTPLPEFIINRPERQGASVLVAGRNFGCGSSREHAVWAIHDRGFEAVIAPSFADIFRNNAVNVGLLPVELPEPIVNELLTVAEDPTAEVAIDLVGQTVVAPGVDAVFTIDPDARRRLLSGLDPIAATLELEDQILAHEQTRHDWMPVISS
ncbi:MAG: 3-isopropylmalate dehydratase small subunit [Acidimicrobiia bacterium]|nr:3-isopropylmalate dehydratase small subunit [Acidimicrobiia bacterium]MDH3462984.1 3-isopropylmalate dehydratase small subunit [Acidimicrobiia bacterium]